MRIDLSAIIPTGVEPGPSAKAGAQVASDSSTSARLGAQDVATLSPDQSRARQVAHEVLQLPEVRQDKIAALRRAIEEGSYAVTPAQAADALIAAMQIRSAA